MSLIVGKKLEFFKNINIFAIQSKSYITEFWLWKKNDFFEKFWMIPNDKYTWEGQKFILCFITCSLHKKSTIKLKLFDVAISVNFWCHNPSLIESPSVYWLHYVMYINKVSNDLSIGSTETKYIKVNTKTQFFFNNIRLLYTL